MKNLVKRFFTNVGYRLERIPQTHVWGQDPFLDILTLSSANAIEVFFDVGANTGQTVEKSRNYFPDANYFCFEPTPNVCRTLRDSYRDDVRVRIYEVAIADKCGSISFNLNQENTTNSILAEDNNSRKFVDSNLTKLVQSILVKSETLDKVCEAENVSKIDMLKMDIQGSEGLALQGAKNLLTEKRVRFIYLEVWFAPIYEKQAYFDDISKMLKSYGFRLFGLYDLKTTSNGLAWADALFVRDDLKIGSVG